MSGKPKLKDETVNNREELLRILENVYQTLYTNKSAMDETVYEGRRVLNQGSENTPDITMEEIYGALRRTKNNKAPGEDSITADMIRIGGKTLIQSIQRLFNLCIHSQNIPDEGYRQRRRYVKKSSFEKNARSART